MKFGVFLPPQADEKKLPVVYWLSGLTCSEENFIQKSGVQRCDRKELSSCDIGNKVLVW